MEIKHSTKIKQKLINFFNLIRKDKKIKVLTIMLIITLFIFTLGYSLSMFNKNKSNVVANIKVNDLSFNITTNSGTSDDRVLHLQAGKNETFNAIITNLNNINTKYELIYDVCSDSNCTSVLNSLPDGIKVEFIEENSDELNGLINNTGETKKINLLTINNTDSDVYIRLNLNAGYEWNELELANQIKNYSNKTDIIAYVDGIEADDFPNSCRYTLNVKTYKNNKEVTLDDLSITCDRKTKIWKTSYSGFVDKIEINFNYIESVNFADYITYLDQTDNGLEIDDTDDKNLRYVGVSPKNYLKFNDETWRIIGVFNNLKVIDDSGNETKESLVKIIRNESLGNYSWDSSASSINFGFGINEWSQADLMYELNCDGSDNTQYCNENITDGYLSDLTSGTTKWYNNYYNAKNNTYDYSNNIKIKSIDKIATVRWNLGGSNSLYTSSLDFYNYERGTLHVNNPADGITRNDYWNGKIALIYIDDYGYASTDTSCRNNLHSSTNNVYNCKNNNWVFNNADQWTLSPYSGDYDRSFSLYSSGDINIIRVSNSYGIRPTLYLKSDIVITGGTGTESDAYIIE